MRGWVYIAQNDSLADMVKIGYTDRDPSIRLSELAGTGLPTPFQLLYSALVQDPERVEQEVHRELSHQRVSPDREFFRCADQVAVSTLRKVISRLNLTIFYEEGSAGTVIPIADRRTSDDWRQHLLSEYRECFRRLRKAAKRSKDNLAVESFVDQEVVLTNLLNNFFDSKPPHSCLDDPDIDEHSLKAILEQYFDRSGEIAVNFKLVEVRSDEELAYEFRQMVSKSDGPTVVSSTQRTGLVCYFCKRPLRPDERCSCR